MNAPFPRVQCSQKYKRVAEILHKIPFHALFALGYIIKNLLVQRNSFIVLGWENEQNGLWGSGTL